MLIYTGAGGAAYTYYNYPNTITEAWKYGR